MKYRKLATFALHDGAIAASRALRHIIGDDEDDTTTIGDNQMQTSPSEELDKLVRAEQFRVHPPMAYSAALARVLADPRNAQVAQAYAVEAGGCVPSAKRYAQQRGGDPGASLHRLAVALVESGECETYTEACQIAIRESPEAAARWASYASA